MKSADASGFTLVELLVALAIGALVLVMVQGVFLGASELREASRVESELFHRSRVIMDRLDRELGSTLFSNGHPFAKFVLSRGREPLLEFSSFASSPAVEGHGRGAVLISYQWQRQQYGDLLELQRNERSLQSVVSEGDNATLLQGITDVQLRCFDGQSWSESWDSEQSGRLPRLLEVSISLESAGTPLMFRTVMDIGGGSGS